MSEPIEAEFDPYRVWLGIPKAQQPPNHYRILGLEVFETDLQVIQEAADRQVSHLKTKQTGKHVALSQKLLQEVATAAGCLLNSQQKSKYDDQLRGKLTPQAAAASVQPAPPAQPRLPQARPYVPAQPPQPVPQQYQPQPGQQPGYYSGQPQGNPQAYGGQPYPQQVPLQSPVQPLHSPAHQTTPQFGPLHQTPQQPTNFQPAPLQIRTAPVQPVRTATNSAARPAAKPGFDFNKLLKSLPSDPMQLTMLIVGGVAGLVLVLGLMLITARSFLGSSATKEPIVAETKVETESPKPTPPPVVPPKLDPLPPAPEIKPALPVPPMPNPTPPPEQVATNPVPMPTPPPITPEVKPAVSPADVTPADVTPLPEGVRLPPPLPANFLGKEAPSLDRKRESLEYTVNLVEFLRDTFASPSSIQFAGKLTAEFRTALAGQHPRFKWPTSAAEESKLMENMQKQLIHFDAAHIPGIDVDIINTLNNGFFPNAVSMMYPSDLAVFTSAGRDQTLPALDQLVQDYCVAASKIKIENPRGHDQLYLAAAYLRLIEMKYRQQRINQLAAADESAGRMVHMLRSSAVSTEIYHELLKKNDQIYEAIGCFSSDSPQVSLDRRQQVTMLSRSTSRLFEKQADGTWLERNPQGVVTHHEILRKGAYIDLLQENADTRTRLWLQRFETVERSPPGAASAFSSRDGTARWAPPSSGR
ncbi:hypothetical protein ETAA8_67030 [Anatilimnocola aggregata]|uniref:Uncharacterized protein n=1 Tax=Anatilimnocola aggregata TaxID=2528021 RepID=A0A517YMV1_9BACT|nr:hypothetical protein [Anatilimnocola aggregata]QDU31544.1 hypothetical protein ETAA8_67030 [Anatilimnocola aggregata]